MKNFSIKNCPLFLGISDNDILSMLECLDAKHLEFSKGDYIWHAGEKPTYIGIVTKGQVNIIREDIVGNRTVIASILPFHTFGEAFSIAQLNIYPVSVQAVSNSNITILDFNRIINTCKNTCVFHQRIIENMLKLIAQKNIKLNNRIDCITKKTTKQKLLFYLVSEMKMENKYEVTIPLNRDELADYLGVNRSALSREISQLKTDGVISFERNKFKLLNIDKLQKIINV